MERTNKLAHLTLVSKYYPVANYSYPRSEAPSSSSASTSSSSFFFSSSRTPYNSRRSSSSTTNNNNHNNEPRAIPLSPPPGLVDDRSTYDSEASSSTDDDDFRYHVHSGELWDSFLEAGQHPLHGVYQTETVEMAASSASASFEALCAAPPVVPAKDYPALIAAAAAAAPQRIKRRPVPAPSQQTSSSWPLSDQKYPSQPRKPSPTYSVFPKMANIPSGTCTRKSSSSQLSTTSTSAATDASCPCPPPQKALPPPPPTCLPPLPPPPQKSAVSQYRSESPRRPRGFSPASSLTSLQRPGTSHGSRPASPMTLPYSLPPTPPPTAPLPALPPLSSRSPHPSTVIASKAHKLSHTEAAPPCHPAPQTRRAYTSSNKLPTRPPPEPLPRSVFEYDTDSDDEDSSNNNNNNNNSSSSSSSRSSTDSPTLSFFRLYRRSQSPNTNSEGILSRRRGSASKTPLHQAQSQQQQQEQYFVDAAATAAKDRRRRRKRTNTIDSLPPLVAKQADLVLSRMLGRRSR
ncbi:hypothetical protein V8C26DRAFT_427981 [Trichoderma gracile]